MVEEKQEEALSSLRDNHKQTKEGLVPSKPMKKVLISSCLLGENVKYDGGNNSIANNPFIKKLQNLNLLVLTCPETEGGLPTPRIPVELIGKKAINKDGEDKTKEFSQGAKSALKKALENGIDMAILKSKSPSCGRGEIYDGSFSKRLIKKDGISAKLLKEYSIKIFTEDELDEARKHWEK